MLELSLLNGINTDRVNNVMPDIVNALKFQPEINNVIPHADGRIFSSIGAEKLTDILIEANPAHVHTVIFSANIELNIPDVEVPVITSLPAWKR